MEIRRRTRQDDLDVHSRERKCCKRELANQAQNDVWLAITREEVCEAASVHHRGKRKFKHKNRHQRHNAHGEAQTSARRNRHAPQNGTTRDPRDDEYQRQLDQHGDDGRQPPRLRKRQCAQRTRCERKGEHDASINQSAEYRPRHGNSPTAMHGVILHQLT